jgi:alpha-L-rhamnosidase
VLIEPFLGDLRWAEGKMPHPDGEIAVRLERKGNTGLEADISLPSGVDGFVLWNGQKKMVKGGQKIKVMF